MNLSNKFQFFTYADDTTIYFNLDEFLRENREGAVKLEKVNTWLKLNILALNANNLTKCMFFNNR